MPSNNSKLHLSFKKQSLVPPPPPQTPSIMAPESELIAQQPDPYDVLAAQMVGDGSSSPFDVLFEENPNRLQREPFATSLKNETVPPPPGTTPSMLAPDHQMLAVSLYGQNPFDGLFATEPDDPFDALAAQMLAGSSTSKKIRLADGSQFSVDEAIAHARSPITPPEVKQELLAMLDQNHGKRAPVASSPPGRMNSPNRAIVSSAPAPPRKLVPPPPPTPPNVFEQAGAAIGQGAYGAARDIYGGLKQMPIFGPAIQQAVGGIKAAGRDFQKKPIEAAVAAAAGIPGGMLGFTDAVANTVLGTFPQLGSAPILGTPGAKPIPWSMREEYLNAPGVKQFTQAYPGAAGVGEFVGGAAVPLPLPAKAFAKVANPVARGAAHGAAAGQIYGTVTHAGEQAKTGKAPDLAKAAVEGGLPTAVLGGTLGAGVGKLSMKKPGAAQEKVTGAVLSDDKITMADGSQFSAEEAVSLARSATTPPEAKQELLGLLNQRYEKLAAPTPKAAYEGVNDIASYEKTAQEKITGAKSDTELAQAYNDAATWQDKNLKGDNRKTYRTKLDQLKAQQELKIKADAEVARQAAKPQTAIPVTKPATLNDVQAKPEPIAPTPEQVAKDAELTQFADAYRPIVDKTRVDNFRQSFNLEEARTAQELTDSQLAGERQRLSDELQRTTLKPKERAALEDEQKIYVSEAMRREQRKVKGEQPDWPADEPDYAAMTEDELGKVFLEGEEAAQMAALDEMNRRLGIGAKQPEATTPIEQRTESRWSAGPDPNPQKAKQGYIAIFAPDGNLHSSSKRSMATAQALAEKLNSGSISPTQGQRNLLTMKRNPSDYRAQIASASQDLAPEHHMAAQLSELAEAKAAYDNASATANAAYDAFKERAGLKPALSLRKKAVFNQELEDAAMEAARTRPDLLGLEITGEQKPTGNYKFKKGISDQEAYQVIKELRAAESSSRNRYEQLRGQQAATIRAGIDSGDLPQRFNIPSAKGRVNIRLTPKQGTELRAELDELKAAPMEESINRSMKDLDAYMKNASSREADYQSGATSTNPRVRGIRSQRGAIALTRGKSAVQGEPNPAAASIAQGASKSKEISWMANQGHLVSRILELRRTLDIARERNADLHNLLWEGISKETYHARGLKFEPEHDALIQGSLSMEPNDIITGANGLHVLSDRQLDYLATRRAIRQSNGKAVKSELDAWNDEYGGVDHMPNSVRHDYKVLEQLYDGLAGKSRREGTGEFSDFGGKVRDAFYDYVFKWNPAYHILNLTDPLVVGSARVGLQNIVKAKAAQLDPRVKQYLGGIVSRSPIEQLRQDTRISAEQQKGVSEVPRPIKAIANLQSKLPDFPSERWNFNDAVAAGLILRGERIKYSGGGTQYLKDLAAGKLPEAEHVKALVDALQVADDITGAGAQGLNKDPLQRSPAMRYVTQFTSQPYRVARLISQWAKDAIKGDLQSAKNIGTFLVMTTLVSGRAALPRESDALALIPGPVRDTLYAVQDVLDNFNITNKIVGRDLVDKMRWSLIPILGGAQTNMMMEALAGLLRDLYGLKFDKIAEATIWYGLSSVLGGGGLEMNRINREAGHAGEGDKTERVYSDLPLAGHGFSIAKKQHKELTGRPYIGGDAFINSIAPGVSTQKGQFVKESRRLKIGKLAG